MTGPEARELAEALATLDRRTHALLDALAHRASAIEAAHAGLAARVSDLGDHIESVSTGLAVDVSTLKGRVRRLEERRP